MAELRYNPLIKDWVMIASHRQERPQMPKDFCPFCPGSGRVPENYDVYCYPNDFPALSKNPPAPDNVATSFFKTRPAYGACEVILYSPDHNKSLPQLSCGHIEKLVDLWAKRFEELSKDEKMKYIFIFENRGDAVGVTMPHPHGQIYAYSVVPKKLETELCACREYFGENQKCLLCDLLAAEKAFGARVIAENQDFTAVLPFFSEYPYGIYIFANSHVQNLTQFSKSQRRNLAQMLKDVAGALDSLFGYRFPYMMCLYQNPVNGEDVSGYYHFHIAFYPPMRSRDKQKFNASSETGAWAHCNPTAPEEKAAELRAALEKFKKENK